jgi:predicted dehydrogenase
MMKKKIYNWGIVGAGHISRKFVDGLRATENGCPYAIAARELSRAQQFASEKDMPAAYGSYEEMANDPKVDAVYIGTTNAQHVEHTLLMLAHKKPVLCEKPFSVTLDQTNQMIAASRTNNTFLMEALWTNFVPAMQAARKVIADGTIGKIKCLNAKFGFYQEYNPNHRVFSPGLGGGSVLDIGMYPIFLATTLLGYPDIVSARGIKTQEGIDMTASVFLGYKNGAFAHILSSFDVNLNDEVLIHGAKGKVTMNHCAAPTSVKVEADGKSWDYPVETIGNGYNYEALEVMRCLDLGLSESPLRPLSETAKFMELLERVVGQL